MARERGSLVRSLSGVSRSTTRIAVACLLLALTSAFGLCQPSPEDPPDPDTHGIGEACAVPEDAIAGEPQGEPLFAQVHRLDFDAPLMTSHSYAMVSTATRAYFMMEGRTLVGIDLENGSMASETKIPRIFREHFYEPEDAYVISGSASDLLVLVAERRWAIDGAFRVYDLENPDAPELLSETVASFVSVLDLPSEDLALIDQSGACPGIYDMRTMTHLSSFYGAPGTHVAASRLSTSPRVAFSGFSQVALRDLLVVYDISSPSQPIQLWSEQIGDDSGQLLVDPAGRLVLHTVRDEGSSRIGIFIRSTHSPEILSVLELDSPTDPFLSLATGRRGAVLAVAFTDSMEMYDLSDPRNPVRTATLDVDIDKWDRGWRRRSKAPWRVSASNPWLAAVDHTPESPALVIVDVDNGELLSSWSDPERLPVRFEFAECSGETRLTMMSTPVDGALVLRKNVVLDAFTVKGGGQLTRDSSYDEILPSRIGHLSTVGGRYVFAADGGRNDALVVMDTADGTIIDSARVGHTDVAGLDASSTLLAVKPENGAPCLILYPLEQGRLGEAQSDCDTYGIQDVLVGPGDFLFELTRDELIAVAPSGERSSLPLEHRYARGLQLSDNGKRLLLQDNSWVAGWGTFSVVDVESPLHPRWVCTSPNAVGSARFVRGGERVFTTTGDYSRFSPWLFDSNTCQPMAPPGDSVYKYAYHSLGAEFGQDRFAVWKWNWSQWKTVVYDLSEDSPRLLSETHFIHGDPLYIPRAGSGQAYMFASIAGCGPSDPTNTWLIEADGQYLPRNKSAFGAWGSAVPLRHGFVVTGLDRSLVVLRDPELNRSPIPDAGPDQDTQCDLGGGSYVVLDGRGSVDPDSTPGTDDDFDEIRWSVDGAFAGDQLRTNTWLAKGEHDATLGIRDVLDSTGEDHAAIAVVDTVAPDVSLNLEPAVSGHTWLANSWIVTSQAEDLCDGALTPSLGLRISIDLIGTEPAFLGGDQLSITLRRSSTGPDIELTGDPSLVGPLWQEIQTSNRISITEGQPVRLALEATSSDGLLARYIIDSGGHLLEALAAGPGSDHHFEASATDGQGLSGEATISLRERFAELCSRLPHSALCRPELLP